VGDVTDNAYEVYTRELEDKTLAVIYLVDKRFIEPVRKRLIKVNIREYQFPPVLETKSFLKNCLTL